MTGGVDTEKTDNMKEMVSVAKEMHWYSSVVFGTIFMVVGLLGNFLSIIVWSRKSLRSSTGTYLIAQAAADICVLIFFFFTDSLAMMNPDIKKELSFGSFYSYIGYPFFFLAVIISIWMTVGVTVDRYIQVCWFTHSKVNGCLNKLLFLPDTCLYRYSFITMRRLDFVW